MKFLGIFLVLSVKFLWDLLGAIFKDELLDKYYIKKLLHFFFKLAHFDSLLYLERDSHFLTIFFCTHSRTCFDQML